MALGTQQGSGKKNSIFVDLKFNATKGAAGVGFRQTLNKTPIAGAAAGEKQFSYETVTHGFVEGRLAGFVVKEEPTFDDKTVNEFIGYASIADVAQEGAEAGPNVVVKFPLAGGAGRRLVGLMNAVKDGDPVVHIYTNHAEAGTKIGEKALIKPQAYLNMRIGDSKGEKIAPVYAGEDGQPLLDDKGAFAQLPMGELLTVNRKSVWDFTKADDVCMNTAAAVADHFVKAADGHADAPAGEEGIDLNEAARAAAPQA